MTLTPGAGHLVHMPGHIFLQTGDFDLAAETNVKAVGADRAFIERTGATGVYPLMYWTHNIHFVAYARAQQGRYDEAKQAANEMVANVGDGDREMQMLEGFRLYPLMIDLRFHRWDAILATPEPERARAMSHAFWRYARAMALAGQGKARDAAAEQRRFERERQAVPPEGAIPHQQQGRRPARAGGGHARRAVRRRARRARRADRRLAARRAARSALAYDEPPAWFYPVRQSLGAALLRGGDQPEAEAVFREALATHPRDGRLLYGLWQSLLAQQRDGEGGLVEAQFKEAWKGATVPLTLEDL